MSSSNGPSAAEIAKETRKQQVLAFTRSIHPEDLELYNEKASNVLTITVIGGCIGFPIGLILFGANGGPPQLSIFGAAIMTVTFAGLANFFGKSVVGIDEVIDQLESQMIQRRYNAENAALAVDKKLSEEDYRRIGHNITAGPQSTIVIDSHHVEIINDMTHSNEAISDALRTLAGYVDENSITLAKEPLCDLTDELSKAEPKPSRIRAFWRELLEAAPGIASLTTAAATISKLL